MKTRKGSTTSTSATSTTSTTSTSRPTSSGSAPVNQETDLGRNQAGDIGKTEYEAIAAFRYAIRRYLRFSEQAARAAGITPQQHQLLLAIKGFPNRERATISELADRLQMRQHSMVGLVDRTEAQGLVRREHGVVDRRQVFVSLTADGEQKLRHLVSQHRRELANMRDALLLTGSSPSC
jgi:DNA-binding MarR family transcriptional regulator